MIVHDSDGLTVHNADLLDALPTLTPGSIDSVVTSPPYAMQRKSTYGGVPEADYPEWTVEWMDALKPALKDDGSVIINISPHKVAGGLSDYVLRTRLALRDAGWTELDEIVWHKTNAMPTGRGNRPRRSWESLLWYGKSSTAYGNPIANGSVPVYRTKHFSTKKEQRNGWDHGPAGGRSVPEVARCKNIFESSVAGWWEKIDHPARYPVVLAEWCAKLICPPGGTVLDPFAGSGSTAIAALLNGFQSVAIEREPEYARMIVDRYQHEAQSTMPAITGLTC